MLPGGSPRAGTERPVWENPAPGKRCDSVGCLDPLTAEAGVQTSWSVQSRVQLGLHPEATWIPPEGPSSANTAMRCPAVLLLLVGGVGAFRICAFNAQRLTLAKVAREHVMDTLVRILARCDIMVLQEVVDPSPSVINLLIRELNRYDGSGPYSFLSSPSLGRSTYTEKYVYIYRSHKTQVQDHYLYDDKDDVFAREPFVAQFTLPSKVLPSLVLVPLHTTPKAVEKELNALYDVFLDVSQHWQSKDMILLGDFNADCASLAKKRLGELILRTQADFYWAIADEEDTTVRASTHCAYDRIVLHGERCRSLLHTATAFNFPRVFQLTEEEALNISDHYPVEVELNRAAHQIQPLSLATLLLPSLLLVLPTRLPSSWA
ncbi:deoxyribonuclease-1-like 1 [Sturnira hondurensis]|uniref:deoxyribonuclease-1-like 1 n=1 Tax=Sturnira hondurensis TaxID=192404 RepID=UPI00187A9950|nr:deoxyribonuclease-1-like 1 [Sturnira hondurensis]XP_036912854.1 deoxyribonuclease-1-like 1 [Sturnira hondurensis]